MFFKQLEPPSEAHEPLLLEAAREAPFPLMFRSKLILQPTHTGALCSQCGETAVTRHARGLACHDCGATWPD